MVLADLNKNCESKEGCNPGTLNLWLQKNKGYSSNFLRWKALEYFGLYYVNIYEDTR